MRDTGNESSKNSAAISKPTSITSLVSEAAIYDMPLMRGKQMNFRGPSVTRFVDALAIVFLIAPVPFTWTSTTMLFRLKTWTLV
jgi:hypothetical protein